MNDASANVKTEDAVSGTVAEPLSSEASALNWDSELQLVSSLTKLQELERKIHELRGLVPREALDPLGAPSSSNGPVARPGDSPADVRDSWNDAARAKLETVQSFLSAWQSPEMKAVWAHVESRIKQSNGQLLQPTGMWEEDYEVLLEDLLRTEKSKEQERQGEEEAAERLKSQASDGGWQGVVERFQQRNPTSVKIAIKSTATPLLVIVLMKAGMAFKIEAVRQDGVEGIVEWNVSKQPLPGRAPTKIEDSIIQCVNARPRKWDLAFVIDMISSYSDMKQTVCVKCNKLTDSSAQLPVIRRAQAIPSAQQEPQGLVFDALHASCA